MISHEEVWSVHEVGVKPRGTVLKYFEENWPHLNLYIIIETLLRNWTCTLRENRLLDDDLHNKYMELVKGRDILHTEWCIQRFFPQIDCRCYLLLKGWPRRRIIKWINAIYDSIDKVAEQSILLNCKCYIKS